MNIKTFLELHKTNKKISTKGKKELFLYLSQLNNNSLIYLDIDYNNINDYEEDTVENYYNKYNINKNNIYNAINLINIYNNKALYIKQK